LKFQVLKDIWEAAKKTPEIKEAFVTDESRLQERQSANVVMCQAHDSSHQVNKGLTSIPMENFNNYSFMITSLNFSHNSLTELPCQFFATFPQLTVLNLAHNQFLSLPHGISSCSQLEAINIEENKLTELPKDFAEIAQTLTTICISKNPLYELSEFIYKCQQLEELVACDIGLEAFPEKLVSLKKLKTLRLGGNAIGHVPASLTQLTELRVLDLSGAKWVEGVDGKQQSFLTMDSFLEFFDKSPLTKKISLQVTCLYLRQQSRSN
jgi:Leucine-rich repeat (LRR) protein